MEAYEKVTDELVELLLFFLSTGMPELSGNIVLREGSSAILGLFDKDQQISTVGPVPQKYATQLQQNPWGYYYVLLENDDLPEKDKYKLLRIRGDNFGEFNRSTCRFDFELTPKDKELDIKPTNIRQIFKRSKTLTLKSDDCVNEAVYDLIKFVHYGRNTVCPIKNWKEDMQEAHIKELFGERQAIFFESNGVSACWALTEDKNLLTIAWVASTDQTEYTYSFHLDDEIKNYCVRKISTNRGISMQVQLKGKALENGEQVLGEYELEEVLKPITIKQMVERGLKSSYDKTDSAYK